MSMYDTQTIEIAADPAQVQAFIEDGANLPRWAIGSAKDRETRRRRLDRHNRRRGSDPDRHCQ